MNQGPGGCRRFVTTLPRTRSGTACLSTRTPSRAASTAMFARCASRVSLDRPSLVAPFGSTLTREKTRSAGTYGTNIELSAFVARYRRPVKVYQPNLVYVMPVEEAGPGTSTPPSSSASPAPSETVAPLGDKLTPRERRLLARAEKAKAKDERSQAAAVASKKKGKEREWQPPSPPEPADTHAEDTPLCIVCVTDSRA